MAFTITVCVYRVCLLNVRFMDNLNICIILSTMKYTHPVYIYQSHKILANFFVEFCHTYVASNICSTNQIYKSSVTDINEIVAV